jgi:hypothetical protein
MNAKATEINAGRIAPLVEVWPPATQSLSLDLSAIGTQRPPLHCGEAPLATASDYWNTLRFSLDHRWVGGPYPQISTDGYAMAPPPDLFDRAARHNEAGNIGPCARH